MKTKIPHLILTGLFGTAIASHAATVEWSLAANGDWDTTTSNWNANTATYTNGDAVQFNDSATGETLVQIAIPGGTVSPASVNFTDGGAGTTHNIGSLVAVSMAPPASPSMPASTGRLVSTSQTLTPAVQQLTVAPSWLITMARWAPAP